MTRPSAPASGGRFGVGYNRGAGSFLLPAAHRHRLEGTMGPVLAEGKTKIIIDEGNGQVLITSKDDITAGDGARHDLLPGKGAYSTTTTANCFHLLDEAGIPNHFLAQVDERSFLARQVDMIPLEIVVRRIATASYLKRHPDVAEGSIFYDLVVEFYEKDDANHDPLVIIDLASRRLLRFMAGQTLFNGFMGEEPLEHTALAGLSGHRVLELITLAQRVFITLEHAWAAQDVVLVDLKIECGIDLSTGWLLVADVIDNDSWRIWPGGDKTQMKDKQVYRELTTDDPADRQAALQGIRANYAWVARATSRFKVVIPPT
jgi:phosphoribosylaminoimidazole-succinocarboxamide synthase